MRIRWLEFVGFGPYRDRQVIDFDQLGESGLYLINGPTGAGKSTIIDAICYALYGRLAGDDADASRMRSDFCAPNESTQVVAIFQVAAGTFRVERSPEYTRPKLRGGGDTKSHATCKLFRIGENGVEKEVAHQVASANSELREILGLTRDQFVQTVVLPQGQFATFLTADTKDRVDLLKKIFATDIYERIALILKEQQKQAGVEQAGITHDLQRSVNALVTELSQDGHVEADLNQWVTDSLDDQLLTALAGYGPALQSSSARLLKAARVASEQAEAADGNRILAHREATARNANIAAGEKLLSSTVDMEAKKTAVLTHRQVASSVGVVIDDDPDVSVWRSRVGVVATSIGQLRALLDDERALEHWPMERAQAEKDMAALVDDVDGLRALKQQLPTLIEQREFDVASRPTAGEHMSLQQRLDQLSADERRLVDFAALSATEIALRAEVSQATRAAEIAAATADHISRMFRESAAGSLAQDLIDGQPCGVCGSSVHPNPAVSTGEAISLDEVERLNLASSTRHQELGTAQTRLQNTVAKIAEIQVSALPQLNELTAQRRDLEDSQEALDRRESTAEQADLALVDLRQNSEALSAKIAEANTQIAKAQTALSTRATHMEVIRVKVEAALHSSASIEARIQVTGEFHVALEALAVSLDALNLATTAAEFCGAALSAFPAREQFGDVAAAEEDWVRLSAAKDEAAEQARAATERLRRYTDGLENIRQLLEQRVQLVAGNSELAHLAETFNSGRGTDVGLHIYVLRALFEEVMLLANERLKDLLNGRYQLVVADESAADMRSLHGLGVAVSDALTDKPRPAGSLSGGETFCVSLALALGLSDAVRRNAGGIEIRSLFVDEGFGTLDNDQLDEVMNMLNQLSGAGRQVGLISHVESMKETIGERIEVHAVRLDQPTSLTVSWMT